MHSPKHQTAARAAAEHCVCPLQYKRGSVSAFGTTSSDLGAYLHVDTGEPKMSHLKAPSEKWICFTLLADSSLFSPVPVYRQTLIQTPKIWSNLTAEKIEKSQNLTCQIYLWNHAQKSCEKLIKISKIIQRPAVCECTSGDFFKVIWTEERCHWVDPWKFNSKHFIFIEQGMQKYYTGIYYTDTAVRSTPQTAHGARSRRMEDHKTQCLVSALWGSANTMQPTPQALMSSTVQSTILNSSGSKQWLAELFN